MSDTPDRPKVRSFADALRLSREYTCPTCGGKRVPCETCKGYRVDPAYVDIPGPSEGQWKADLARLRGRTVTGYATGAIDGRLTGLTVTLDSGEWFMLNIRRSDGCGWISLEWHDPPEAAFAPVQASAGSATDGPEGRSPHNPKDRT